MTKENTGIRPKNVSGRIFKALGIGGALLLTIAVAAHFVWMYSGSNQWEPVIDKNGIKVYTLKAPGILVKRVRGITHVKTTMNAAVGAMMADAKISENCKEWFPGCTGTQTVQPWNSQDRTWVILFRVKAFGPFAPREFLVKGRASQDPQTKAVLVEYMGVPDDLPQNSCCFRVAHLANSWLFTPLDNGLVEVENRMNVDMGIPYFMFNRFIPGGQYRVLGRMQKYLDEKKDAKYEGIKEKT